MYNILASASLPYCYGWASLITLARDISRWKALRSLWWVTAEVYIVSAFTGVYTPSGWGGELDFFHPFKNLASGISTAVGLLADMKGQGVVGRVTCRPNSEFSVTIWQNNEIIIVIECLWWVKHIEYYIWKVAFIHHKQPREFDVLIITFLPRLRKVL